VAFIEAKDLVKVYSTGSIEVQALRGLNIEIEEGQFVSIMGPSGSGKTTLLNILGGLDTPTAGKVIVQGVSLGQLSFNNIVKFRREVVGHIFQSFNLIPTLTAYENVELPMIAAGKPRNERHDRIMELLSILGIADRAKHKPDELSGGEQQRVAIAAALANDPPIILADEPTGELDTTNARMIVDYLNKINKEMGKTIIMVTHDPSVARKTQKIFRIEDGRIIAAVRPSELKEETSAKSYGEQIRLRIEALDEELRELDEEFKSGRIDGDQYSENRLRIKKIKEALIEELHRMGESI